MMGEATKYCSVIIKEKLHAFISDLKSNQDIPEKLITAIDRAVLSELINFTAQSQPREAEAKSELTRTPGAFLQEVTPISLAQMKIDGCNKKDIQKAQQKL